MSSERPDDEPAIFRLPPEAFRVDDTAAPADPPAPEVRRESPASERPVSAAPSRRPTTPRRTVPSRTAPEPEGDRRDERPPRRRKTWDVVLTIALLLVTAVSAGLASALALMLAVSSGGCGTAGRLCRAELLDVGVWTMLTAPWIVFVLTAFFAIVLLVVRRRGFWVPIVGTVLVAVAWGVGAFLLWAAV